MRFGGFAALVLAAAAVVFLRMALNAVDGMLAREFGQRSALGGYLNEITDVAADAALSVRLPLFAPSAACRQIGLLIFLAAMSDILRRARAGARRRPPLKRPIGKSGPRVLCLARWLYGMRLRGGLPGWLEMR